VPDVKKIEQVKILLKSVKCFDFEIRDVRLVCDRIGISTQHGINGRLQLGDYFHARTRGKIRRYRRDYAIKNIACVPAILSVAGKIHPEFLRLLWMMTDRRLSISMSLGMKMTSGVSVSSGVVLAYSAIIGMRLALLLHTLQSYTRICWNMAKLTL